MKQGFLIFILLLLKLAQARAQDPFFSQFYANPTYLNPALTGSMAGKYRLLFVNRDQSPDHVLKTSSASADFRFGLKFKSKISSDRVGAGILFVSDRNTSNGFSITSGSFSLAYHKILNKNWNEIISAGVSIGIQQRNTSFDLLNFQDQFDGISAYSLSTSENIPNNNFAYGDYSAGVFYSVQPQKNFNFFAGVAIHHFNQPEVSFYQNSGTFNIPNSSKLPIKYTLHTGLSIALSQNGEFQWLPGLVLMQQGNIRTGNIGSNFRWESFADGSGAFLMGFWARPVSDVNDQINLGSMVGFFGFEFTGYQLGLSMDLGNLSRANNNYSLKRNALELSFIFTGDFDEDLIYCPRF
jgi:type IX secretion system PorP/SprF family membrane protein